MSNIDVSKINRILVITLSNVGDIILTSPVVEALLSEFPGAKLDVMVGPRGKEIFENHEKISDIIIYDKKTSPIQKFSLFLKLRSKKYSLVADLRNTVLPLVLGAKYNTSIFRHAKGEITHKKHVHLSRLEDMGIDTSGGEFNIPIKDKDREYARAFLNPLKERPFVVVSPGAKSHVKRWPLKHFARLADLIKKNLAHEIVLIGDETDRIVIGRILFYMKSAPLNLIEKTNVAQLAYIIKKSKLLITNDSAPLHIASAVGARILAFFGPTDFREYGPLTKSESKVLRKEMACSPCKVAQCVKSENKYECLKSISADEAFQAVKELLS